MMIHDGTRAQRIYRVDRFTVPGRSRAAFLDKVGQTHELLRVQPGFVQDMLLEQPTDAGDYNIVTIVEWESEAAIVPVQPKVQAMHRELNFNRQEFLAQHGIEADLGTYRHI